MTDGERSGTLGIPNNASKCSQQKEFVDGRIITDQEEIDNHLNNDLIKFIHQNKSDLFAISLTILYNLTNIKWSIKVLDKSHVTMLLIN